MRVLLVTFLAVAVLTAQAAITPTGSVQRDLTGQRDNRECQCMPWRNCDGEINSDVQCHPSYIMICCVRPKPEVIPPFVPSQNNLKKDDIQVVQV